MKEGESKGGPMGRSGKGRREVNCFNDILDFTVEGKEMTEEDIEADLENTSIFSCLPAVAEVAPTIR